MGSYGFNRLLTGFYLFSSFGTWFQGVSTGPYRIIRNLVQRAPNPPEFAQPRLSRSKWHRSNTPRFVVSHRGKTSHKLAVFVPHPFWCAFLCVCVPWENPKVYQKAMCINMPAFDQVCFEKESISKDCRFGTPSVLMSVCMFWQCRCLIYCIFACSEAPQLQRTIKVPGLDL